MSLLTAEQTCRWGGQGGVAGREGEVSKEVREDFIPLLTQILTSIPHLLPHSTP